MQKALILQRDQDVIYQQGDYKQESRVEYIAGLFKGEMSITDEPNDTKLVAYSKMVYDNTPYTKEKELHAKVKQAILFQ
jgi:hypothetical protein